VEVKNTMASNIMIIDDSPIDRKIIRQIIEKNLESVNVFEAEEGVDIHERLISENIDMCILDIMMPIKDGFTVLKDMKEHCFLKDIPVIVCTGINDNQAIVKALTLGAYDYFAKPLSEEVMKVSLPLKVRNAIELMKRNKEISYLSYHDALTGIYNRRFYEEELKKMNVVANLPISIVMADINGLKLINDTFGHVKGDILLKEATLAIENGCRACDIVARWGGDEFIILMPKTDEEEAQKVVKNIKEKCSKEKIGSIDLSIAFGWDTKTTLEVDIAKVLKNAEDYMYRNKSLESESTRSNMINTIMNTLLEKNPREEMHSKRVSEICGEIGRAMKLSDLDLKKLKVAGLLHDIGKIAIEEEILNKPGKLTQSEWNEIERHPAIGYRILSTSHEMLEIAQFILAHHEKWDGTGYPRGLKGEAIPQISRIIAVADSYDAMSSERAYRSALSEEIVLEEIKKNSGIQFDPKIARIFVEKVLKKQWN
jgi:diguanylate cyclase (GGDEF)-like protein/putative nucleotidyltransferase with HDIG domain